LLILDFTVYDPTDALGLPGDTHSVSLDASGDDSAGGATMEVGLYRCGPVVQVPAHLAGCDRVGEPRSVDLAEASLDVRGSTLRLRGSVNRAGLDVTVVGSSPLPYVSREWRRADGRERESGRTVTTVYQERSGTGTMAGRPIDDLRIGGVQTARTTVHHGTGPQLPLPAMSWPPTAGGPWSTTVTASAVWSFDRSGRVAWLGVNSFGPEVGADVTVRGCGDPACPYVASYSGVNGLTLDVDPRAGRIHAAGRLGRDHAPGDPGLGVDFTWTGRHPVAVTEVETVRLDPGDPGTVFTSTGIRWLAMKATGTVEGAAAHQVRDATVLILRSRSQ
jgi:hypothetical protein